MHTKSKTPAVGSYAEYVVSLSTSFPELQPLAELMTGGYSFDPMHVGLRWTSSDKVDVVAVDIFSGPSYVKLYNIKDLQSLNEFCSSEIPADVDLRLFLVEDMTAVVVETLGGSFNLPPQLFNYHMNHSSWTQSGATESLATMTGQPLSRFRDPEYFSFPFKRFIVENIVKVFDKSGPRQRSTMYRDHDVDRDLLEERVSGMICNDQSSRCRIGVFLFDGSMDFATGKCLTAGFEIQFQGHPKFRSASPMPETFLANMRDVLLNAFSSQFAAAVLADESTMLWFLLRLTVTQWLEIIGNAEAYIPFEMRFDLILSTKDLIRQMKNRSSFNNSVQLLEESAQIIKAGKGWKMPSNNSQTSNQTREDLETDIEDLIKRYEAVSTWCGNLLQMFAAYVSIEESQKAIGQSKKIGVLTGLATFYIPLSFVTSFFGMNLSPLIGSEYLSIWVFFVIAIPLTVVSLYVVLKWDLVYGLWNYVVRKLPYDR